MAISRITLSDVTSYRAHVAQTYLQQVGHHCPHCKIPRPFAFVRMEEPGQVRRYGWECIDCHHIVPVPSHLDD
jgi:hypothetical protein